MVVGDLAENFGIIVTRYLFPLFIVYVIWRGLSEKKKKSKQQLESKN